MSNYLALRTVRIMLFGAFVISLPFAWTLRGEHTTVADIVRYLPVLLLVLGLIAGLVERIVREARGHAAQTFWARLALTYAQAEAVAI